jgi:hypothetical protein
MLLTNFIRTKFFFSTLNFHLLQQEILTFMLMTISAVAICVMHYRPRRTLYKPEACTDSLYTPYDVLQSQDT